MKIFYLIFTLALLAPTATFAQQLGWGNQPAKGSTNASAKDDLEQIDEPEESDDPDAMPEDSQPKRLPVENPKKAAPIAPLSAEEDADDDDDDVETGEAPAKWLATKLVKLQGLNKVTAKTIPINAKLGEKVKFGNLEIQVDKCMRGPNSEKPDNTALMTIWDGISGQTKKQVFHGWMFSSSPALSALEHPIYDVILLECSDK